MSLDQLEQDQHDFYGRILADEYFTDVKVLLEAKGDIEPDVIQALSVFNDRGGKIGACVVVLMPTLTGDSPDAPGPRSTVRMTVQVIDQPIVNLEAGGTGKSASQIAERVRKILHMFSTGRSATYTFAAQEPIPVEAGRNSYGVAFTRLCTDCPPRKVATVAISLSSPSVPSTATLTTATAGAAIRYTLDGSFPGSANTAALLYSTPFIINAAATLRTAAELTDHQASDVSAKSITA